MEAKSEFYSRVHSQAVEHLRATLFDRDIEGRFDKKAWSAMAETGLMAITAPRRVGGEGLSGREIFESLVSLGRGGLDIPFGVSVVAHLIGIDLIVNFASEKVREKYLESTLRGTHMVAVCNSETGAGTNLKSMRSSLTHLEGERYRLNVHKSYATNLSQADIALVSAWSPEKLLQLYLLEDLSSQIVHDGSLMGFRTGATGEIKVEGYEVDARVHRLGGEKDGALIMRRTFDLERLMVPCVILGVLEEVQASALEHLKGKYEAGVDLASKQYIQQKVINIYGARLKLRTLLESIVSRLDFYELSSPRVSTAELSFLKMMAIEEGLQAAQAYYELMGSLSFHHRSLPQKILRDLLGLKFLGGTDELHKMMLFRELAPYCKG